MQKYRERLFKKLFPEYAEHITQQENEFKALRKEYNSLRWISRSIEALPEGFERVRYMNYEMMGIVKTKSDKLCIVAISKSDLDIDPSFDIYILSPSGDKLLQMFTTVNLEEGRVKIDDIQNSDIDRNDGIGTIALAYAETYAKSINCKKMVGSISGVDIDHFDRLEHFYQKNGFNVEFDNERSCGKISKDLTKNK